MDIYMDDYYMDRDGNVYSMKSGKATRMQGSVTTSGRYLTLNKRTHRADDVFRKARVHPHFVAETSPTHAMAQAPAKEAGLPAGRSRSAKMLVGAVKVQKAVWE